MSAVLQPIVDYLGSIESADGTIQTEPFLATCRLILPVFDRLGVAFVPAKSDVSGNIERLAKRAGDHPVLFDIAREEMAAGTQASNSGCCKGMLWLKRFLVRPLPHPASLVAESAHDAPAATSPDLTVSCRALTRPPPRHLPQEFTLNLLAELSSEPRQTTVKEAASRAYERCLKPFHGWIAGGVFSAVLSFPPSREAFVDSLGGDAAYQSMAQVARGFGPVLEKIHAFLVENNLDDPTKV